MPNKFVHSCLLIATVHYSDFPVKCHKVLVDDLEIIGCRKIILNYDIKLGLLENVKYCATKFIFLA